MSTATTPDVIDAIVGITPDSALDALRRARPVTRSEAQASFDALFAPRSADEVTLAERALVAAFATRVTGDDDTAAFYRDRAAAIDPARAGVVAREASAHKAAGPFGRYAEPGLQHENTEGPRYRASDAVRAELGERLTAALEHAHLLVVRPREADAAALAALADADWSADAIVTLSQLVAFLSFQQRVVTGLQIIAEEAAA